VQIADTRLALEFESKDVALTLTTREVASRTLRSHIFEVATV